VNRFSDAGFQKESTFLAGHSAGGWLALWALALNPGIVAGAIAFAPAFAGQPGRPPGWEGARSMVIQEILRSKFLPSLVYAFDNDEWESPADLAFLSAINGVRLVTFQGKKAQILTTSQQLYHSGAFHPSFAAERQHILDFIAARIEAAS
jgi:pimeloyl-ACP methyl ester carboxylesterase